VGREGRERERERKKDFMPLYVILLTCNLEMCTVIIIKMAVMMMVTMSSVP
jgi:hypothetical protein